MDCSFCWHWSCQICVSLLFPKVLPIFPVLARSIQLFLLYCTPSNKKLGGPIGTISYCFGSARDSSFAFILLGNHTQFHLTTVLARQVSTSYTKKTYRYNNRSDDLGMIAVLGLHAHQLPPHLLESQVNQLILLQVCSGTNISHFLGKWYNSHNSGRYSNDTTLFCILLSVIIMLWNWQLVFFTNNKNIIQKIA